MKDYQYNSGSKTLYRFTEKRYDSFGKVISEAEVDCSGSEPTGEQLTAARITYIYDNDDRLLTATYPSAFDSNVSRLEYVYGEYDRLDQIKAVSSGDTKPLREYVYDGKGKVVSIKDNRTALGGTGYTLKTYGYDKLERATSIAVTDSEKTGTAEEYTYAYDKNNHIVKETKVNNYPADAGKVNEIWNYEYDALGRLTSTEVYDKGSDQVKTSTTYTYDGAGNRLSETKDEVTVENTYNGLNQMLTSGDSSFNYDANGNLLKETDSGQDLVKTYSYDADNRLSEAVITKEGTQTLSQKNIYNGDGQRISKTDNNVTTKYSYQGGSVVYTDGSNDNQSLNIMGEVGNIIAAERGTGSYFYNKDMRGSTTTILDGAGNSEVSYEYTDFGATTAKGDFYNEICYTGGIYDNTTGLYYLNARYYDPDDGRFVTQDTYRGDMNDPSSLHLYAYCANNPVNYVDPSGHARQKNYSASHSFKYSLSWGQLYINLVVKWQVKNKKIVDCYSYVSRKSSPGAWRIESCKRDIKIKNQKQRAMVRYTVKMKYRLLPEYKWDPFGLSPKTYRYPAAIVYNDGGKDWYKYARNMRF